MGLLLLGVEFAWPWFSAGLFGVVFVGFSFVDCLLVVVWLAWFVGWCGLGSWFVLIVLLFVVTVVWCIDMVSGALDGSLYL